MKGFFLPFIDRFKKRHPSNLEKLITAALFFIIIFLVVLAIQPRYKIVFQTDYSVNFEIGILDLYKKTIEKGEYFGFYFLALNNDERYGWKFVKRLACKEGEHLETIGRDFYCNSEYIGTAKSFDKKGNPTTIFHYKGIIPRGSLFAIGESLDSFDSKYWGFVDQKWILGKVSVVL